MLPLPASASAGAPIAFTGPAPAGARTQDIVVSLQPGIAVTRSLANGQSVGLAPLPRSAVSMTKGVYVVRLDPGRIAARFKDPGGVVTFDVTMVLDGGRRTATTGISARIVGGRWADAEATSSAGGRRVAKLPAAVADPVSMTSHPVGAGRLDPVSAGNCVGPHPRKTQESKRLIWSTIGTTYPVGLTKAWMDVSSSEGASYGRAVSLSGKMGSWNVSGSRKITGGWGKSWNPIRGSRSYRKQVEYRRYHYEFLDSRCNRFIWEPIVETGGTDSKTGIPRPDFTKCAPADPGLWWRDRSDGSAYSFGSAVKFADLIGIDLGVERQYSRAQKLTYNVVGDHRMCGSDGRWPSHASKVMERYAR